jgi:hypothetical protein
MKNSAIVLVLIFWVSLIPVQAQSPAQTPTPPWITIKPPTILKVDHPVAPSGAVIRLQLDRDFDPSFLASLRLAIDHVTTKTYVINRSTVAAVVPYNLTRERLLAPSTKPIPVDMLFFYQEHGGDVFRQFSVFNKADTESKTVEISSIREIPNSGYLDVVFSNDIPLELWGKTKIYFDDKSADNIVRMDPGVFTVEQPKDLPTTASHSVYVKVGENKGPAIQFSLTSLATASPVLIVSTRSWARQNAALIIFVLVVLGLLAGGYLYQRGKLKREAAGPTPQAEPQDLFLPEAIPEALVDACAQGECVLYAGAGLGAQSGLPTWSDLVSGLLNWALENRYISDDEALSYVAEVARGQADAVADSLVSRLNTQDRQSGLNAYLRRIFLGRPSPSALHSQLKRIKFSGVLTANFDDLLEGIYETSEDKVLTPRDSESLLAALTRRAFFILKLYGTLDREETVIVAPAQYESAITGNTLFSEFMQTLFFSRSLLFVGASMEGIEAYLRGISFPKDAGRRHYAVVAVSDVAWRAKAEVLERRYGIKVLPYTPKNDYAELRDFLNKLAEAVSSRRNVESGDPRRVSRLKRVVLENIGPFERLALELDLGFSHNWHIFLGDNGVGKSTVLKAIALALCGKDAQPFAGRFLRESKQGAQRGLSTKTTGRITLETDNKTSYVTTIQRDDGTGQVELISTTARPLEAEGWLAIGFPPLRTTSWEAPKGPDADIKLDEDVRRKSRPVVSDLSPLVAGDVDPRLDKFKQWIVNLDYLDIKSQSRNGEYSKQIQKLFDIIGSVAEDMRLTYKGVGAGNRILIETEDGTSIPLEALSQGTISLIGWIGILMQRLYQVFGTDGDPTQSYALILIDELDAHMHPRWQRTVVSNLSKAFPNAQFIATTHSPLLVSGLPAQQVVRFVRDKSGAAVVLPIAPDMTLGYTDQVLTSLLFGLSPALDRTTELMKKRFYELDRKQMLEGEEQTEYEHLRQELIARVPAPSGTYEEKHERQKEEAEDLMALGLKLSKKSPEEGQVLINRAKKLLETIGETYIDQG